MARAQGSPQPHPAVEFALREFQANPVAAAISEVSGRTGLSRRRFIRMFDDQVGLTPKLFCRVRRFHQAVRLVARGGPIRWAQLSLDCGYFDQAHFIRDFTEFCGFSPSAYLGSRTGHLNHVRAAG
jgi:AraC-like DNA-binding protein